MAEGHDHDGEIPEYEEDVPESGHVQPVAAGTVPKTPTDDPSLRVARLRGRQLKKGGVVAAVCAVVAFGIISVAVAGVKRRELKNPPPTQVEDQFAPPVVPESIRNATTYLPDVPQPATTAPAPAAEPLPSVPSNPSTASVHSVASSSGPSPEAIRRQKQIDEFYKARGAGILVQTGPEPEVDPGSEPARADAERTAATPEGRAPEVDPRGAGAQMVDADPNMQGRKNDFMGGTSSPSVSGYLKTTIQHRRSPYELSPGTIVPAVLVTAINSDLPGPVIARVTANVCDSANGDWLLIPQGATLVAYYDSMVAWGQERVLVCWKQLEMPNGDSLELGCMPAADVSGQAGLNDEVNEHWWRIIKGASVASLLSAATTASAGSTTSFNPSLPQLWARGAASEVGNVGEQITRRNIMIQPTITIRQGMPVNVIITKNIDFRSDEPATPCGSQR